MDKKSGFGKIRQKNDKLFHVKHFFQFGGSVFSIYFKKILSFGKKGGIIYKRRNLESGKAVKWEK